MFSNSMIAHLHELIGSINLSYRYYEQEKGMSSVELKYIIENLYNLISKKSTFNINTFIENLEKLNEELEIIRTQYKNENPEEDTLYGVSYMYMKSMAFAQLQMTVAIAERILNQRYFNQFYQLEPQQEHIIKNFLNILVLFLNRFSKTII